MSKIFKWAGLAIVAALVVMQFFGIDKTNPPVNESETFMALVNPPAEVAQLLKDACYDCHSNESKYPWYTNVAPVSWWIADHIEHGREHLNFSTWGAYDAEKQAHKAEEAGEEVEKEKMPMKAYLPMHPEARLTDAQRDRLSTWFMALAQKKDGSTVGQHEGESHEHEGENHEH